MSIGRVQDGYVRVQGVQPAVKEPETQAEESVAVEEAAQEENRDVVDFSAQLEESREKQEALQKQLEQLGQSQSSFQIKSAPPKDNSALLTQRLVAATMDIEVRKVMIEAGQALTNLQIAAANCEKGDRPKIEAMIRRMKKLLDRGGRKIKDLGEEQNLRSQQARAQQAKQQKRAEELKTELRKRQAERRKREQKYLNEAQRQQFADATQRAWQSDGSTKLDAASEAQIDAEAEAMAAAEVAVGGEVAVPGGGGEAPAADGAAEAGGAEGGGEAAAAAE